MPRGIRTSDRLKEELVKILCTKLNLECDNIDFNDDDDTGSAGFLEKILLNLP